MRILLLSPEAPPRGVLRALVTLGIEPVVARPTGEPETDGITQYVRVAARGDATKPMDLRWSRKALRVAMRDVGPSLVHIVGDPWTPTAEAGAAAARDLKVPYVLVGTSSVGGPTSITARWQAKRIRDGAVALAGITRPALDHLANGSTTLPVGVLPHGGLTIPPQLTSRADRAPLVFGAVGRLVRERGLDLLLDALGRTLGDWRLRVVGTGPAQEALEAQAQQLGLSARLEWIGALGRDDIVTYWPTIDVLVAPSRVSPQWVEPTGTLVLEAMGHGVAALVSRSGALPDVVGESGLIVDTDDGEALSRALQGLVEHPERVLSLGAAGRERVLERYGDVAVAERMATLWRRALATA